MQETIKIIKRIKPIYNFKHIEMTKNQNFGQAIRALKRGARIVRESWDDKGMFVFKQIPAEISLDIIPKMQSVPKSVKEEMLATATTLKCTNQMAIVNSEGRVDSWVASSSDTFAEDWIIYW